ncbi:serine--tRNA ligase [Sphingomonas sp. GB1N7]|uniref:serine--tRNA ligase n=1 Tax=Parasphingomonas caseinilytica TaxID=3096158 RepID=UPI002FCBF890
MHDIRLIRENPQAFDAALAKRGVSPIAHELVQLDEQRRKVATQLQAELAERNAAAKAIGAAKAAGNELAVRALMDQVAHLKTRVPTLEASERNAATGLSERLAAIPNLPLIDVPEGADENDNQLIHTCGTPTIFSFRAREHDDIGQALGLDFETGAAMSGSRFTLVRGDAAKLHRALGQFMLDTLTEQHGYELCVPPLMVRDEAMFGTGQLPKFTEDLFKTMLSFDHNDVKSKIDDEIYKYGELSLTEKQTDKVKNDSFESFKKIFEGSPANRRWLIPTAEVSLTNIVREKILSETELPLRFTALTPCFRSEAGSAGRDTRGFIRQHQFEKVEMVSIVTPDASEAEHERMTACAEGLLDALGLPFRRMKLCTGDMGFTAARTYDLEVWLPGQNQYREISSCSTCTDFQARRMNARYRPEGEKATRFVHTLNGSGLAVGRTLVAVVENYQQEDGSVAIPDVLQPYLKGLNRLEPA